MIQTLGAVLLAALLLTPAGSFLTGLLTVGPDAGASLDNRCGIDPDGGISCPDADVSLDTRCGIDPDGRCEPGF
jgi:hypothetical protein